MPGAIIIETLEKRPLAPAPLQRILEGIIVPPARPGTRARHRGGSEGIAHIVVIILDGAIGVTHFAAIALHIEFTAVVGAGQNTMIEGALGGVDDGKSSAENGVALEIDLVADIEVDFALAGIAEGIGRHRDRFTGGGRSGGGEGESDAGSTDTGNEFAGRKPRTRKASTHLQA